VTARPRTLPIRVPPLPGEALDSWLEATAARLDMPLRAVIGPLGLARVRAAGNKKIKPPEWVVCLQAEEAEHLATVTGVGAAGLHAMTLRPFDGQAIQLNLATRSVEAQALWGRRGSRFCPDCLADSGGRWQIRWRLGWSFACLAHRRLLADTCPRCHRVARLKMPSLTLVPAPGRCGLPQLGAVRRLHTPRCDYPLTDTPTIRLSADSPILQAQQLINDLLTDPTACQRLLPIYPREQATSRQFFIDLKALAAKVVARAHDTDLTPFAPIELVAELRRYVTARAGRTRIGFAAPPSTAVIAPAVTAAIHMLRAGDFTTAEERTRTLVTAANSRPLTSGNSDNWGRLISPTLRAIIASPAVRRQAAGGRISHRASPDGVALPAAQHAATARAPHLPAAIWPWWALRLIPPTAHTPRTTRKALSLCLLRVGTRITKTNAANLLQPGAASESAIAYLLHLLDRSEHGEHVIAVLTMLADTLDSHGSPIDYARRRAVFGARRDFITRRQWQRIIGPNTPDPGWLHAQRWLFEQLTGSLAESAPAPLTLTRADLVAYQDFRARLLPAEAEALHQTAARLLTQHDIDEPVTWHPAPPPELINELRLPGPHPDSVTPQQIHHLVLTENLFPHQIAKRLSTSTEHVRYLQDAHPVDWNSIPVPAVTRTQAQQWKDWYVTRGWTLNDIIIQAQSSDRIVRRALTDAGVTIRPPRFRHLHLADKVINRRLAGERTLTIARTLGVPQITVERILLRNGIQPRLTPTPLEQRPEIVRRYTIDGQSMKEIGRALDISDSAVARQIDRAGVPRRDRSTATRLWHAARKLRHQAPAGH
jgi:hypothetical protein